MWVKGEADLSEVGAGLEGEWVLVTEPGGGLRVPGHHLGVRR